MKSFVFAIVLLLCPVASAGELVLLNLSGVGNGTYLLTITDTGASVQAVRVLNVGPTPTPTPPPTPDVLTERAKQVKAAAEAAVADPSRAETATALAASMVEIKKLIDKQQVTNYAQISAAVAFFFDQVTAKQPNAWKATRTVVMNELARLAQEGVAASAYATYLAEAGDGLTASAPGVMLAPDWSALMKMLLEIFIKYILPLILTK